MARLAGGITISHPSKYEPHNTLNLKLHLIHIRGGGGGGALVGHEGANEEVAFQLVLARATLEVRGDALFSQVQDI